MKKINLTLILCIFNFLVFTNAHTATRNKIIANIQSQVITSYELKNKILTILSMSKEEINQKNINATKNLAMQTLIVYKIRKEEVTKFKIEPDKKVIDDYLANVSKSINNSQNLKNYFIKNNIDYDLYLDEIKTQFAWQKLILNIYGNRIKIDEKELEYELNEIMQKQSSLTEFNLAEIEILIEDKVNYQNKIDEVVEQINSIGFENTAIKYSSSPTSLDGGKIGWINQNSLSIKFLNMVSKMASGQISKPFMQGNTMTIIKLLETRKINVDNVDIKKTRQNIILNKKNEMLNLYSNNHLSKIRNNAFIKLQ